MQPTFFSEYTIRSIYIMMGWACNFHCRHCIEDGCDVKNTIRKTYNPEIIDYIKRIYYLRDEQELRVAFWGGEPLLYIKVIKQIVDELKGCRNIKFGLTTNGALMTDELVDYFNDHKFRVNISNDGRQTDKIRDFNVLENPVLLERFKRIHNLRIAATTHAYNIDPLDLRKYVDEKFDRHVEIGWQYILECNWNMPKDLYDFDEKTYRENLNRLRKQFIKDVVSGDHDSDAVNFFLNGITRAMLQIRGYEKECQYPNCMTLRKRVNIDLNGGVHVCKNIPSIIGTVTDDYETLLKSHDQMIAQLNKENERGKGCPNCWAREMCGSGCPFTGPSFGQAKCCQIERIYWDESYKAVLDAAHITEEIQL